MVTCVRQSWKIFTRDIKRLFHVKKAWIVLAGVLIIPALYSWVNVRAFWDPYGATGNIGVAVVNEDHGASSELSGSINVGQQIVAELRHNDLLGWQFLDADAAEVALQKGDVYASITIPPSFSSDLLHMIDGTHVRPTLHYRANEKNNVVATVMTDTAASELQRQITAIFKQQLVQAATSALSAQGKEIEKDLTNAHKDADTTFAQASQGIADARSRISTIQTDITDLRGRLSSGKETIAQIDTGIADIQKTLTRAQALAVQAQSSLADYADTATSALVEGTVAVADATGTARSAAADITAELDGVGSRFKADTARMTDTIDRTDSVISALKQLLDSPDLPPELLEPLKAELDRLDADNAGNRRLVEKLQALGSDTAATVHSVNELAQAADQAAQSSRQTASTLRSSVTATLPAIDRAMSAVTSRTAALSANLNSYKQTLSEARTLIDGILSQLTATQGVLSSFDSNLASLHEGIDGVRSDIQTLMLAAHSDTLVTITGLDASRIGQFFAQPVTVTNTPVFPINSYGSAMAALFTNLSLWIGAFALMVIFRVEVDTEGLERVTVGQAYLGRFLLLALIVLGQAGVVTLGDIAIGVQTVNPAIFVVTGMLIGVAYFSIIYALTSAFGHVGRGLAVVLAILQIPGASGLYPIELMPNFFRLLYPVLPLSYGINAMREVIGGFYGNHYALYMAVLVLMCVMSFGIGLLARKGLAHFNVLFNRELARTNLVRFEKVQVVGRGYRIADIIRAMQGKERFAADLARRTHNYLTWIRVVGSIGLVGMIILGCSAGVFPAQKTLILGVSALWFFAVMMTVVALEYLRQSLRQSTALTQLSDDELRAAIAARGAGIHMDDERPLPRRVTPSVTPHESSETPHEIPATPYESSETISEMIADTAEVVAVDENDSDAQSDDVSCAANDVASDDADDDADDVANDDAHKEGAAICAEGDGAAQNDSGVQNRDDSDAHDSDVPQESAEEEQ